MILTFFLKNSVFLLTKENGKFNDVMSQLLNFCMLCYSVKYTLVNAHQCQAIHVIVTLDTHRYCSVNTHITVNGVT